MAVAIVIVLRLLLPLTILRWPLGGAILALVVDTVRGRPIRVHVLLSRGTAAC